MGLSPSHCAPECFGREHEFDFNDSRFIDVSFPPTPNSLGEAKLGKLFITQEQREKARWVRVPELLHFNQQITTAEFTQKQQSELTWTGMSASDLAQGSLGNCWLVATIAALARRPGAVRRLFVEAEPAAGRFVVQLFDMATGRWELVEVDDFVPCTMEDDWSDVPYEEQADGTRVYNYKDVYTESGAKRLRKKWVPLFGRPNGRQVWALILEKAMAKFVGSYANLSGGTEPFALMALTGFPVVYVFQRPASDDAETAAFKNHWEWKGAQYAGRSNTGIGSSRLSHVPDDLLDEEIWEKLVSYMARTRPVTASITRFPAAKAVRDYYRPDGLISGHAYAVLDARQVILRNDQGRRNVPVRLVALKNPHGDWKAEGGTFSSTWLGEWGHQSPRWQRHPEVVQQLDVAGAVVSVSPKHGGASPGSPQRSAYQTVQSSESCFWMPWDEFKVTFDKLCVSPKPSSAELAEGPSTIPLRRGAEMEEELCPSLVKMAPVPLRRELHQVSVSFDPYVTMPEFLDDGSLETRLRWEASKPGHLQQLLEANRSNGQGPASTYAMLQRMVETEGLQAALGTTGSHQAGHCRWRPAQRPSLKRRLAEIEAQRGSWLPANPISEAADGCVVS